MIDKGRAGRQGEGRLGDELIGRVAELRPEHFDFVLAGGRTDQHAVTARPADLLHDQFVKMIEHVTEGFRLAASPRRDVL